MANDEGTAVVGSKIITGLQDAAAGNFARVTISGQLWVRADIAALQDHAKLAETVVAEARRLALMEAIAIANEEKANCVINGVHANGFRHACHAIAWRIEHLDASSLRSAAEKGK